MKPTSSARVLLTLAAACSLTAFAHVRAGDNKEAAVPADPAPETSPFKLSGEFDLTQSYVGEGDVRRGGRSTSLDEYNSEVRFILTPRIPLGYLRLGAEWNRYNFGYSDDGSPLPNTLQSVNLVLGLDTKFSDSILLRIEAQPGFYGTFFDHLDSGQFNVPFIVGGTYLYNADLQIIFGLSVDIHRKFPIIPGAGVRWKFAPQWVLNLVLPTPRLEYELSRATTLYAGAEIKEDTFRMDDTNRDTRLERKVNRALVTFSEVRAGAGVVQKLSSVFTLSAEAGCQPYREFDYDRADVRYRADGLAPYGQISLHGAF